MSNELIKPLIVSLQTSIISNSKTKSKNEEMNDNSPPPPKTGE